jgi:hypothetical protein
MQWQLVNKTGVISRPVYFIFGMYVTIEVKPCLMYKIILAMNVPSLHVAAQKELQKCTGAAQLASWSLCTTISLWGFTSSTFVAECAADSATAVPYDNRLKVFLHGGVSNSAPVLFNVSAEITLRVACCCSSNMEIVFGQPLYWFRRNRNTGNSSSKIFQRHSVSVNLFPQIRLHYTPFIL